MAVVEAVAAMTVAIVVTGTAMLAAAGATAKRATVVGLATAMVVASEVAKMLVVDAADCGTVLGVATVAWRAVAVRVAAATAKAEAMACRLLLRH